MPTYLAPGIYVEERSSGVKPIAGASTSVAALVGVAEKGRLNKATLVTSFGDFVKRFGGPLRVIEGQSELYLYYLVRHFFEHGGASCYVVRVADTSTAAAATATLGSLTVTAINEGDWAEALAVEVVPTSQYSHLLLSDATVAATAADLAENEDVRIGSLLWFVDEASGVIESVDDTTNQVTFAADTLINRNDGTPTAFPIPSGAAAYTPDFVFGEATSAAANVQLATATTVSLPTLQRADGRPLRPGDTLNFALAQHTSAVTKVSEVTGGTRVDVAVFPDSFLENVSRVYERGFTLNVLRDADNEVLETHERLSLVATDPVNHVSVRLPAEVHPIEMGLSFFVSAAGSSTNLVGRGRQALTGGNDGLPSSAMGDALNAMHIVDAVAGTGLHALDKVRDAGILVVAHASAAVAHQSIAYVEGRRDMVLVFDPPRVDASSRDRAIGYVEGTQAPSGDPAGNNSGLSSTYAATYFPWIRVGDPLAARRIGVPPSGAVAGIYARSDTKRGVHKAPAGIDVGRVDQAQGVTIVLTKADNDFLHGARINAIRTMPEGILVWGGRTISTDPEWVHLNVRRLFVFLEQSIERGTQWVAFEPNEENLRAKLRKNISAFLRIQWLEGKLVGATQEEAFYVKCDAETNPPEIVDAGQVVTEIGVAPSRPAEFVVFRIQQLVGGDA